jgi:hypothetical protein
LGVTLKEPGIEPTSDCAVAVILHIKSAKKISITVILFFIIVVLF